MSVLITNADDWISLAVARSLGKKGIVVGLASHRKDAMSFRSKYCKKRHIYRDPSADSEKFIDDLVEIVKDDKYEYIIPTNDVTLMAISRYRNRLEPYVQVPLANHETIEACDDKSKTIQLAQEYGVPCPQTHFIEDESDLDRLMSTQEFPLVIKPFRGQGARGVKFVLSPNDLKREYKDTVNLHGDAMVQECIIGDRYLLAALYNKDHKARRASVHKVIRFVGGATIYGETVHHPEVMEQGLKLFDRIGFYGMEQADFIVDRKDEVPKLMEINPRFFASMQIHIEAGVDYSYLLYRMLKEGDIEKSFEYKAGAKSRFLLKDTSHLFMALTWKMPYNYTYTKKEALINYLKSFTNRSDYIFSASDPGPGISEIQNLLVRKITK